MDRVLIANFNAVVRKSDTVDILGDLCHHMQVEMCNRVVAKLNGSKILISGNHDRQYDSSLFTDIRDFLTVTLDGVCFSLMHYPLLSWPKKEHGVFSFTGIFTPALTTTSRSR